MATEFDKGLEHHRHRPAFGERQGSAASFAGRQQAAGATYKANGYRIAGLPQMRHADEIRQTKFAAIKWAIPGFVPEGLGLLAGPKSRGKSFIALDWALSVASGSHALGSVVCDPGAVLYLALEDSERRINDRMAAILQGRPAPHGLEIATEWKTFDHGGLDDIRAWISAREGARLVIIDVLAKVKSPPNARKGVYDQEYELMTPLYALARDEKITVLPVHHTNKAGADDPVMRVSGTQGLTGACDTVLVLERAAGSQQGELHVRGRDVAERSVAIQFDSETGCCTLLGPADDFRKSEQRREIMRLLIETKEPMTPVKISSELGRNRGTIRRLLSNLNQQGDIGRLPNGKYYCISGK